MDQFYSFLTSAGIFIAAIFILVIVHELGHFLAARLFGMRVERFSIGFPPRVWGKQIGDTDYCISATPLGGYVKISGMVDESLDTEQLNQPPQPWEFRSKPVWQKSIVIAAGVIFNMILAWMIYTGIIFGYGESFVPAERVGSLYIPDSSLAWQTGFRTGDHLVAVNGKAVVDFNEDVFNFKNLTADSLVFTVIRSGDTVSIGTGKGFLDRMAASKEPLISLVNAIPSIAGDINPGSPAEKGGLTKGDRILSVDGTPIAYWMELVPRIRAARGAMALTVERGGDTLQLSLVPDSATRTVGVYPVDLESHFGIEFRQFGLGESMVMAGERSVATVSGIVGGLKQMVSGSISVKENLGGPIAIARVTRQATESGGWRGFWVITAYLSITLAVMNLLPLPVLDGGHLVFLAYEAIARKEPSVKVRMYLQQAGLVFFILMFVFVMYNDIIKLVK